jgi:heme exporter protein A
MNLSGYDNTFAAKPDAGIRSASDRAAMSMGVRELACSRNDRVLFSGLDFTVSSGQLLLIEGANGSGKTSLLKTLCGFIQPDEGEVLWRGSNIRSCMDDYLAEMHYVGHTNGIKSGLTCAENLRVAQALDGNDSLLDPALTLQQYGLGAYVDTQAQLLSSGQRRRLALARLSISQADIWILDEPFTSLDESGKNLMKQQFLQQLGSGGIIVLTSHEPIPLQDISPVLVVL